MPCSFTVVTPSYNQAEFLARCIESVEAQTLPAQEHLVFDPGSNDGSREIASSFVSVSLFAEADNGQADAVSKGMRAATGDVIAWLNSDDEYYSETVFEDVSKIFADKPDVDLVYGNGIYIDQDGGWIRDAYVNSKPASLGERLKREVGLLQPAVFFRRKMAEELGFLDCSLNFCLDYEFWIRAAQHGKEFHYADLNFARARYYESNKTLGQRGGSLREVCGMLQRSYGFVSHDWLKRLAEYELFGVDGVLTQMDDPHPDIETQLRLARLHGAYNSSVASRKLLSKPKPGTEEARTRTAMNQIGSNLKPMAVKLDGSHEKRKGEISYKVGETTWSFDRAWYKQQFGHTKRVLTRLRRERKRSTCIIVGNGPSLNDTDLSLLKDQDVFVSNYACMNPELLRHAKYLAVTNYLVAEQGALDLNSVDRRVIKLFPYWLGYCLAESDDVCFFKSIGYSEFGTDIFENVSWRSTVSFFNLQIAFWLGYERVLLVGFDHSYAQKTGAVEGELLEQKEDDVNHFHPDYFKGKVWQAADTDKMGEVYELAKEAFEADGRKVINCSVGGSLEIFPRKELQSCLDEESDLENSFPRVLVLSSTGVDSRCATGSLLGKLFADWPKGSLAQIFTSVAPDKSVSKRLRLTEKSSTSDVYKFATSFRPDVLYIRTVDDPLIMSHAVSLLHALNTPLITHTMDDWPARHTGQESEAAYTEKLNELFAYAHTNLSISTKMSEVYRDRYGLQFENIANGAASVRNSSGQRTSHVDDFIMRYCGGLADDMNATSVRDVAGVVAKMRNNGVSIRLEIYTMPWFKEKADEFAKLSGIESFDLVADDEYEALLDSADLLLIAYNFDSESVNYTSLSLANKAPECLASAAPVLAYGPSEVATIEELESSDACFVLSVRDQSSLERILQKFVDDPQVSVEAIARGHDAVKARYDLRRTIQRFRCLLRDASASYGWSLNGSLSSYETQGLLGPHSREQRVHVDETSVIARYLGNTTNGGCMLDVGAQDGRAAAEFLSMGWKVYAFEPDKNNRSKLKARFGNEALLYIDERACSDMSGQQLSFYTSFESTGMSSLLPIADDHEAQSTVSTITLDKFLTENPVDAVDFLKIGAEGFDLKVLRGYPFQRHKPRVIKCEFEDQKTVHLGSTTHDLARLLLDQGYSVYVSEWHPIERYGISHSWKGLLKYPCKLSSNDSWGYLLAFYDECDEATLVKSFNSELENKSGSPKKSSLSIRNVVRRIIPQSMHMHVGRVVNYAKIFSDFYRSLPGMMVLGAVLLGFVSLGYYSNSYLTGFWALYCLFAISYFAARIQYESRSELAVLRGQLDKIAVSVRANGALHGGSRAGLKKAKEELVNTQVMISAMNAELADAKSDLNSLESKLAEVIEKTIDEKQGWK